MCVLLVTFPPSSNLEDYLRTFISKQAQSAGQFKVDLIAQHCLGRLEIAKRGARGQVPSLLEIETASEAGYTTSVFGQSLESIMANQVESHPDMMVPIVLHFLTDMMLSLGATSTEGIFRLGGDLDSITELKVLIDRKQYNHTGSPRTHDIHVIASLFKLWLRELKTPLIPSEMYNQCLEVAEQPLKVTEIVKQLPTPNRRVFLFVVSFLQRFVKQSVSKVTKMTPMSLALIFAPNLFRCPSSEPLGRLLLRHWRTRPHY